MLCEGMLKLVVGREQPVKLPVMLNITVYIK